MDRSRTSLTLWHHVHLNKVDMCRPAGGPNDLLGDIVRDERLKVGINLVGCDAIAAEARDAELGFDHS